MNEELSILDAIYDRHSVRHFTEEAIPAEVKEELNAVIAACNESGDLAMRAWYGEPLVFDCQSARMARFKNVQNYIVLAGEDDPTLEERCGYYGQMIVLKLQQMGLNSCWVGDTYSKRYANQRVKDGKKLVLLIAFGYGETNGEPHGGKFLEDVVSTPKGMPNWFKVGAEAALLAPTAKGKQAFKVVLNDEDQPMIVLTRKGPLAKVDLGILKCNFEMATGCKLAEK